MILHRASVAAASACRSPCPLPRRAPRPYPTRSMAAPQDMGAVTAQTAGTTLTVTLPLKLRDEAGAEALLKSVSEPGSARFHQFLTPAQFKAEFAQSDADVSAAIAYLASLGLTSERVGATSLEVTGTASALQRAFQVSLHRYEVPARADAPSFTFRAPTSAAKIPAEISSVVAGVVGLSTRPMLAPHYMQRSANLERAHETSQSSGLINEFGSLDGRGFLQVLQRFAARREKYHRRPAAPWES